MAQNKRLNIYFPNSLPLIILQSILSPLSKTYHITLHFLGKIVFIKYFYYSFSYTPIYTIFFLWFLIWLYMWIKKDAWTQKI